MACPAVRAPPLVGFCRSMRPRLMLRCRNRAVHDYGDQGAPCAGQRPIHPFAVNFGRPRRRRSRASRDRDKPRRLQGTPGRLAVSLSSPGFNPASVLAAAKKGEIDSAIVDAKHRCQGPKFARPGSNARSGYLGLVGNFESGREGLGDRNCLVELAPYQLLTSEVRARSVHGVKEDVQLEVP